MKIELKDFQETAAREMLTELENARREIGRGRPQAIVLSSPTGSGKTATVTALMEAIVEGDESHLPDRDAVFLWLSDSPELNSQSRDKILRQSSVFHEHDLVIVEPPFGQEQFESRKIYFLNIQKLGKESLLTKRGDEREYTIWQTIQNTSAAKPEHFCLIIDEAHRGMTENTRERNLAASIVQRFIKGYPESGLEPIKLIIGMSATPERFNQIIEGSGRIKRPIDIDPNEVKLSGLLKERIILFHPDEKQPADWTLLEEAARRWTVSCKGWEEYCAAQEMEHVVRPVLVIQVEDGTQKVLTQTNLDELVRVVERVTGTLPESAWTHSFQEDKTIEAGGRKIRKIEASKIEEDSAAQIVLFKMSLTTGWDCPRAEVMMSFRRARDDTLIAQLVGRMVRTPLARTVEGNEFLNSVSLYLPHYDKQGLQAILNKLNNPDPEIGPAIQVEEGANLVSYKQDPTKADCFAALETLPTYRVQRIDKSSNVRRLMKLARQLTMHDEVDLNTLDEARSLIVQTLGNELTRLSRNSDFVGNIAENQMIDVRQVSVEYGEWSEIEGTTIKIPATPENVEDLFNKCGRQLGEGLHMEFWKAHKDLDKPLRAKLELYGILIDKDAWKNLEIICGEKIQELFKKYSGAIRKLSTSRREVYNRIKRVAREPEAESLFISPTVECRKEEPLWERHLYVEANGKFGAKLDTWEVRVLEEELAKNQVVGWLRNIPRKDWALAVPYEMGREAKPLYSDFVVFRTVNGEILTDILDPHTTSYADALPKAKGLAEYAAKHGDQFGRIESIIVNARGEIKRLDVNQANVRRRILKLKDESDLNALYEELG